MYTVTADIDWRHGGLSPLTNQRASPTAQRIMNHMNSDFELHMGNADANGKTTRGDMESQVILFLGVLFGYGAFPIVANCFWISGGLVLFVQTIFGARAWIPPLAWYFGSQTPGTRR
ncbi:hypothetical protein BDV28DRAFT_129911 [Aspergillus coremiiformis]|uniref:Uncharacterized protein n=1 Tax=Aspergillus coremiiformis TaxID=138285 RepID=A0A5N6ZDZ2_9EURO|nr:hypothetical protein BDV28DRAFT_129911 [Aspergillus coremiiformis]